MLDSPCHSRGIGCLNSRRKMRKRNGYVRSDSMVAPSKGWVFIGDMLIPMDNIVLDHPRQIPRQ